MNYGEKIAYLRKTRGMTQEELGKILNVTYQAVSKWERGESLPDFPTMSLIAKFFQVPLDFFEEEGGIADVTAATAAPAVPDETATEANTVNNFAGVCTVCGKMLKEDEVFCSDPKIMCKSCHEREEQKKLQAQQAAEAKINAMKAKELKMALGRGCDKALVVSLIVAVACMILFTVMSFMFRSGDLYIMLLVLVPMAAFACVQVIFDLVYDLKFGIDEPEGYTLKLSLIIGAAFSVLTTVLFIIIYFAVGKDSSVLILLAPSILLPFTFVSQIMWGSAVKKIFTCGGFTFKVPGFIFSLDIDSIILMIILKFILGALSIILLIITTVIIALFAMVASVIAFIPCIAVKIVKDKKARNA